MSEVVQDTAKQEGKQELSGTKTALAVAPGQAYVLKILAEKKANFEAANPGIELDYVRMGKWLVTNKKGQFVEKDTKGTPEEVNWGETIDVIIAQGEKLWSLWGKKDTDLDSVLIVAEKEQKDAVEAFREWAAANPKYAEDYSESDIALRFRYVHVPVASIKPDEYPEVYLSAFSPTATISFGQYARDLFEKGDKAKGIPKGSGVSAVVTRLYTKELSNGNNEWCGVLCEPMGLFNPAEYGLK
jgi:hypothetical protein